ncbi:hypothetical protein DPEC_G00159110 [Dallia pectoralis]|uniref:Uncharacterized protein n=1 Tax=Dallia pectoralis TaxID=75939 RepID=A0ACC2GFW3_DALPE|nr:hypothetical protein DPEC_G00159110 [Dallia pectoralis]
MDPGYEQMRLNQAHIEGGRVKSELTTYGCRLTLDPNTTNPNLIVSEGNRKEFVNMKAILLLLILLTLKDLAKTECEKGFHQNPNSERGCWDEDECGSGDDSYPGSGVDSDMIYLRSSICGGNSTCVNTAGSYYCQCPPGFTYNLSPGHCVAIQCEIYGPDEQTGSQLDSLVLLVRQNCLLLANSGRVEKQISGIELLQNLVNTSDAVQHHGHHRSTKESSGTLSKFLSAVENIVRLIGPQLSDNTTRIESSHTDVQFLVNRDKNPPSGPVSLITDNVQLDTNWETVTGDPNHTTYPGFAFVVIISYRNLTFSSSDKHVVSNMVTIAVSNPNTHHLVQPVNITFTHLGHGYAHHRHTCVYWMEKEEEGWSKQGCRTVPLNSSHTLCTCRHLSTFGLIREIHQKKSGGYLGMLLTVCVVMIICVAVSLLSTMWCRYISNKRNERRYSVH